MPSLKRLMLPICYMAGIFVLSSIPDTGRPDSGLAWVSPSLQNLLHIPLYGGLAGCWYWALERWSGRGGVRLLTAFALTLGYGVLDELHQLTVPGRFGSLTDLALNALGAALILAWLARTRLQHGHPTNSQTRCLSSSSSRRKPESRE